MDMTYQKLLYYAEESYFAERILDWRDSGYLMKILPEIAILDEYVHNPIYHPEGCTETEYGTALDHVIEAVRIADSMLVSAPEKLYVLFHDIGKGVTAIKYDALKRPYHNFYGHEHKGVYVMKCLGKRYNMPKSFMEACIYCIRYHMCIHRLSEMRPFKVEGIVSNPYWEDLKLVSYCDDASRGDLFDFGDWKARVDYGDSIRWANKHPMRDC